MTTRGEELDHTPLTFGKYRGRTPSKIAEDDPSYIVWMYDAWIDSLKTPPCSKLLRDDCAKEASWGGDQDPDDRDEWEHPHF